MSLSFNAIEDFRVTFQGHTHDEEIPTNLNRLYSDALPFPGNLFIDPITRIELLPNNELIAAIKSMITEELIAPHATDTPNPVTTITPFINAAALFVEVNGGQRRLSKQTLTKAMQVAITKNRDKVDIRVNVSHLHADRSTGPVTMLNWNKISTTAPSSSQQHGSSTLTMAEIAAAVAGAIPPPPPPMTPTTLATALAAVFPNQPAAPSQPTSSNIPSANLATTLPIFNHKNLPRDVKIRYENKINKGLVLGSDVNTSYSTGNRYHLDGLHNFILADGTLFTVQADPNEKALMKATIYCDDDSHVGIRSWYQNFAQACHDYGYYAHPLWCFLPDHGGDRSFTIGDDPDDDLPRRMEIPVAKMSHTIFRLLSKKEMFPRHSRIPGIIRACDGDGYRAIKAILFKSHPAFHDQPATLITAYPKQRDATILEYWKLFQDFQQLRAYISDINTTLDSDTELDIFLRNAKYSDFLNRVTRDERRLSSKKHKYMGSQLVETLDKLLMAPDSPAMKPAAHQRFNRANPPSNPPASPTPDSAIPDSSSAHFPCSPSKRHAASHPGRVGSPLPTTIAKSTHHANWTDDDVLDAAIASIRLDIGPAIGFPDVYGDNSPDDDTPDLPRALMDTGAFVSCTGDRTLLHHYVEFTAERPSPINLAPATLDSDTVPQGYGYLHVPADTSIGYLAVRAFYTPALRTTVIDERDLFKAAGRHPRDYASEQFTKQFDTGTFTWHARHKRNASCDILLRGILRNGKLYSGALLPAPTNDHPAHQLVTVDADFRQACERATLYHIFAWQEHEYAKLRQEYDTLPQMYHSLPFHTYIQQHTPINAIRKETERLLWHQRLGHPSDYYLYHAHKHIKGVPRFPHHNPILDSCPTCIQCKQTKTPAGPHTTRTATVPYQGLSIDFSFAGMPSKNKERAQHFLGLNGETCWILVSDHYSRMLHGDTRVSKASPLEWLRDFLASHAPDCPDKYVVLDQGGELYGNPKVRSLFSEFGYTIRPTGADASHQNGPVERSHLTVANAIRSMLVGANLPVKFWPYAFHHWLRIHNSLPSRDQPEAPLKIATGVTDDFTHFRTFGCRVWVRPPGKRDAKFRPHSRRGIFLGFLPRTTTNILWFDPETNHVKIASHARFDEGMNDLPVDTIPPNVIHLQRTQLGQAFPADPADTSVPAFDVGSSPFFHTHTKTIKPACRSPTFGLLLATDQLNNRVFIADVVRNSSTAKMFSSHKAATNKLRGAYVVAIDDTPVFTQAEAAEVLARLRASPPSSFTLVFAPERRMAAKQLRDALHEHNLFAPDASPHPFHSHSLTLDNIRAIAALRFPDTDFSPAALAYPDAIAALHAIRSTETTLAEQALGHLTRRKLKRLDTWPLWQAGEHKQLDQFHDLRMYGPPIPRPRGAIVLRPHWQYHIKRDGTRRARNCCDGSLRAAPALYKFANTYSSCVEQPIQRLFFALAASHGYLVFGGDAKDAYAHSPPPSRPTYVAIDDAYAEWYHHRFGVKLNRSDVLPVLHALQGHPESGRLWEEHITAILLSLGFTTTTHDKSIYRGTFDGHTVFLLRQVDDFALAAPTEALARSIFDQIGKLLQLPSESQPPFNYLGLLDDFNGVNVHQFSDRTVLSCENYIDRILRSHGWSTPSHDELNAGDKPQVPLPSDSIPTLYATSGHAEGTPEHQQLVDRFQFSYRTLLGELLYAYVTCRPDIGYAVITLSKFAAAPGECHFALLKKVAKYLRHTRTWGIHYHRTAPHPSLPPCPFPSITPDPSLPSFPALESGIALTGFIDAAHANDLRNRRSTTGYAFLLAGGAISYKCKTQPLTATSSTEAEFYAAVSAAKHAKYLRAILHELGFPQHQPTPLHCDNESAIKLINARIPTERSRHILIQYFAIQDWKDAGEIILRHIPGIINPSDDLTKPLGWILHSRHARRLMGHFLPPTSFLSHPVNNPALSIAGSGESVELVKEVAMTDDV